MKKAEMRAQIEALYDADAKTFIAVVAEIIKGRKPQKRGRPGGRMVAALEAYYLVTELEQAGISRRAACRRASQILVKRLKGHPGITRHYSLSAVEKNVTKVEKFCAKCAAEIASFNRAAEEGRAPWTVTPD